MAETPILTASCSLQSTEYTIPLLGVFRLHVAQSPQLPPERRAQPHEMDVCVELLQRSCAGELHPHHSVNEKWKSEESHDQ